MPLVQLRVSVTGLVWKVNTEAGQEVHKDETLIVLESMKTEIPINAIQDGIVQEIKVREGDPVSEDEIAVVIKTKS
ncbi:acetyl-CoA carboxylase biotin carboxyl carrier protein subunit [Sporolactobacillus pectinivorans]|uniref:acetyl-CoA carboxylase biotin carboxyl carrier protein subunit n=1 Tax=Sporolactobacillus pectinivorans TaxID=1591408 RepID=UPI000C26BFBF|nr:acetyl-CoA carboxylase biotin carboxyl carrier protein subunit [Sporolactobacillus pectinivorans]